MAYYKLVDAEAPPTAVEQEGRSLLVDAEAPPTVEEVKERPGV